MERRVRGNSHARCGVGENLEITSKDYLSLSIWADVSAWDKNAEFLGDMFKENERRTLVMCGSMADKPYQNKNGQTVHRLSLTLDAFWGFGTKPASNGAQNSVPAAAAQNAAPAAAAQPASQSATPVGPNGFLEMEELDDNDVPF